MPLYDYQCVECNHQFEAYSSIDNRHYVECIECGRECVIIIKKAPGVSLFKAGFYEHVSLKGAYCETPEALRRACEANDAKSVYLENSGVFRSEKLKEI